MALWNPHRDRILWFSIFSPWMNSVGISPHDFTDFKRFISVPFSYWVFFVVLILCHLLEAKPKEMGSSILKFIVLDIFSISNTLFPCPSRRHKTSLGKKRKWKQIKCFIWAASSNLNYLSGCRHPEMASDIHTGEEGLFMSPSCNYMKTREKTIWLMKSVELVLDDL